jgi:hypothetical protein
MKFRAVSLVVALRCQSAMSAIREGYQAKQTTRGSKSMATPPGRSRVRFRAYHKRQSHRLVGCRMPKISKKIIR